MSTSPQTPPPPILHRRRSIFPGLLLIVLGLIFLLHRMYPGFAIGHIARVYWPLLIVLWGVAKLIDHFVAVGKGQLRAPILSPDEAALLILLALVLIVFGMRDWVYERAPWLHIDLPLRDSYTQSREVAPQTIPPGAHVTIDTERGNITIHGSGGTDLRASVNESAKGENETDADERMKSVDVVIEKTGSGYSVHPMRQSDFRETVGVDLDVQLPNTASVTLHTPHGDISVSGIAGGVDARTENGDVEIHQTGGDVTAQVEKGDVRIDSVGGNVTLKGRGDDVEIADVKGNAALDGAFVGTTVVRKVAGTTQIASPWAELFIAQLTGRLEMDSGDLNVSDVGGAAKLQTHNKDIDAENIVGQLDINDSHGDVKVTCTIPPREPLNVTNESGDVELTLPGRSSFQIAAYSRSGEVESEFEGPSLRTTGEGKDGRLEGQFGGNSAMPAARITINTTYGTISLHKSS